jgi:AcrR family transcriptional regulator
VRSETRDKIKKVALVLFASDGYDAASMDKIATGVGIKKSSLYAFIKSKESLFWEIYEQLENEYVDYIEQLFRESAAMLPVERLFYLFKQYLLFYHTASTEEGRAASVFWIRVMFFPPAVFKEQLLARALKHEQELGARYLEIINEGITQGTIREENPEDILLSFYSVRQGLYSLLNAFMEDMALEQKVDKIDKIWHTYWQGIKK